MYLQFTLIHLSVLAVLDEDEQTLINVNIVDKEKVRSTPKIIEILLNDLISDSSLPSSHNRNEMLKFHPSIIMVIYFFIIMIV